MTGHLMECAAQITGGYFADPGFKDVKDLAYVGFPIAEVHEDGRAVITKLRRRVVDHTLLKNSYCTRQTPPATLRPM